MAEIEDKAKDGSWLIDSGVLSRHMTPETDNLSDTQEYLGKQFITIGNGLGLPISNIGTAKIRSNNNTISLKNTLCVSNLKINLISIQSMSKDLNCSFIVNDSNFKAKDNITGSKLLESDGHYYLNKFEKSLQSFYCFQELEFCR